MSHRDIALDLIADSAQTDTIVHMDDYDKGIADALLAECEDSTDSNTETEYWGATAAGQPWRVHVPRST